MPRTKNVCQLMQNSHHKSKSSLTAQNRGKLSKTSQKATRSRPVSVLNRNLRPRIWSLISERVILDKPRYQERQSKLVLNAQWWHGTVVDQQAVAGSPHSREDLGYLIRVKMRVKATTVMMSSMLWTVKRLNYSGKARLLLRKLEVLRVKVKWNHWIQVLSKLWVSKRHHS